MKPRLSPIRRLPPKADADFVCAMEDVLKVHNRDHDGDGALVCVDETSRQQTRETRTPLPALPGRTAAHDFECERSAAASLFMVCAPLTGWRRAEVTDRRTKKDFARALRDIADLRFPDRKIVLVMDNLNTHKLSTHCEMFPPAEASRLAGRFEASHTPKHGSWLNMAEIEISALSRRRLARHLGEEQKRGCGAGGLAVPGGAGALQTEVPISINTIMELC